MYCPNPECPHTQETGEPAEYRAGVTHCDDCGTALVETRPARAEEEDVDYEKFVPVFDVPSAGLVPFIDSLLQQAGIRFFIKGIGSSLDFVSGPVKVWVEEDRARDARELLEDVRPADGHRPEIED